MSRCLTLFSVNSTYSGAGTDSNCVGVDSTPRCEATSANEQIVGDLL